MDMHVFYSSFDVRQYTPIDRALTVKRLTRSILFWNVFFEKKHSETFKPISRYFAGF